jgi:1-acyl-sn-glycerol-3-phosphate acyltransferase
VLWTICSLLAVPLFYGFFRLRRSGREHIPKQGGLLILCNHISVKDPPLVGAAALPRKVYFMAKSELFGGGPFTWLIRGLGAFPVVRNTADRRAIRTARDLLLAGGGVVMFPEGTRSITGILGPGLPGAGGLALLPGVTVVPAAIWGTRKGLGPVRVTFGEPMDLSDLEGSKGTKAAEATSRVMAAIAELVPKVGGPEQPPPRRFAPTR